MKERVKELIFIISIVYSLFIIALMLYSFFTSHNIIELNDSSDNIELLNNYKESLKNIKESTCKSALNDLIAHYEKTSYNGEINFKNQVEASDGLLNHASSLLKSCNFDEETRKSVVHNMLIASIQFEEVLQKFYFQYEIRIPDLNNRELSEPSLNVIRYSINRNSQLETIKLIIDYLKGEFEYE